MMNASTYPSNRLTEEVARLPESSYRSSYTMNTADAAISQPTQWTTPLTDARVAPFHRRGLRHDPSKHPWSEAASPKTTDRVQARIVEPLQRPVRDQGDDPPLGQRDVLDVQTPELDDCRRCQPELDD